VGAVAVLASVVTIGLVLAHDGTGAATTASDRTALLRYAAAIHPLQLQGGQLIAEEIRPRLADLEFHKVTPEEFRVEASGWRAQLEQVRKRLDAVHPPPDLTRAAALYDLAMRQYEQAVDGFVTASRQPGSRLASAITAAVPAAEQADKTYDEADAAVDAEARSLNITPPEPPGPPPGG
jgi:hypothetical protein